MGPLGTVVDPSASIKTGSVFNFSDRILISLECHLLASGSFFGVYALVISSILTRPMIVITPEGRTSPRDSGGTEFLGTHPRLTKIHLSLPSNLNGVTT